MPTQSLCNGLGVTAKLSGSSAYRGGPLWPWFPLQFGARTCRGWLPWPCDSRPFAVEASAPEREEAGIWCGPASPHFGHMISDFGMRIATASRCDPSLPLVFSVGPGQLQEPEPFFWQILAHFGVAPSRAHLVQRPTLFRALFVPRQADRHNGRGPDRAHLDLMDAVTSAHGPVEQDLACLFVSRARYPDGRLIAEGYLAEAASRAGAAVIYPEIMPIADQLIHYRRARRIVFSEGSAVHGLQLLGRLQAEVAILVRRPGDRIASSTLRARLAALSYWDTARMRIHGLNARGRPQWDRAMAFFDEADLAARFGGFGVDLAGVWDRQSYCRALAADIVRWIGYNRRWNLHPAALAAIRRSVAPLGLAIDVDAAWSAALPG